MKVLTTDITHALHSPVAVVENKGQRFSSPLHCHPEIELVYIKAGSGKRILGDKIDEFKPGDVVLLGSGLPHKWINDNNTETPASIVAYFNKAIFATDFYSLKESQKLDNLFSKASLGLNITGTTRELVSTKLERLTKKTGFKKILGLMEILHLISVSIETESIVTDTNTAAKHDSQTDRLAEVYQFLALNFEKDITLHEVASIASLTEPAFCRLFKKRTARSFIEYLNEIRVSAACKYLQDTDLNISIICSRCGFNTISNFNKRFKKNTGFSPKEYRQNILQLQN